MGFSGTSMTLAIALKLADQMSGPLQDAVKKTKDALEGLSKAGAELGKIKLFETTKNELEQLQKQFLEAQKQRDFLNESANKGGDAGAKMFKADIAAAKEEVLKLARAIEDKKKVLGDAGQALRDAGVDMDNLGARAVELSRRVERETRFDALSGRLKEVANSAREVGEKLEAVGRQSLAGGLAIGASVGKTVTAYASQEEAIARLKSAMMSSDGLSKNFERIQALTIELGNRLPGNTADFANMATALLQLGVSEEAILGGVGKAAANLAVVMRLPYEEAAEIAAKLKEATGTTEADMLRFMDVIQRTGAQGVKSGEMMLAFARSAGALKQYGIQGVDEAEKLAAVYAQLIKSGASGETVGTGMAAILNRLVTFDTQNSKVAKGLRESGIELEFFDKKTGSFKGIDNLIAQMDKLKTLSQEEMGGALQGIFGAGQDAQFMAQLAMSGKSGNQAMKDRMAAGANIDTKVDVQLSTLAAKWEAATGTFSNLLAAIGETMAPKLGEIVDWFGKISEAGMKLVSENKELFGWLGLGAAVVAGTLVTGGALAIGLNTVAKIFSGITEGMAVLAKIGPVLGGVTDSLVKWGPQLAKGLQTVGAATAKVIAAHPILAAIFGAVAIGFLVYDNRKALASGIKSMVDGFSELFSALADKFKDIGQQIMNGLMEGIKSGLRWVQAALRKVGLDLPDSLKKVLDIRSPSRVFMEIGENIGEGLAIGIANSTGDVADAAKKMAEVVVVEPSKQARTAGGAFKSAADAARQGSGFKGGLAEYFDSVKTTSDAIKDVTVRAFQGMEDALTSFVTNGKLDFKSLANSIIADMARMMVQQSITKPLATMAMSMFGFANGGAPGGVSAWRNQVVDRPTFFAFASGGVMGEAGPEAIMPLSRGAGGRLGVDASGMGGVTINVINNASGAQTTTRERTEGNNRIIDVLIEQIDGAMASGITRGSSKTAAALGNTFGLNRVAGAY